MASESKFNDVKKKLENKGYYLVRISGSHHIFKKKGIFQLFSIPVHNGKVKNHYVKEIDKIE